MQIEELRQNVTVYGPLFPEPVQIIIAVPMGSSVKLIGKGVRSNTVYEPILNAEQLGQLHASPAQEPFDGDAGKFRLGVEAMRLGLAYEYDPYFSLSIARVDPLPHQLEAVYDYFIKLPRIRFLLADDPGAGKTIMAGLLIKELKIRGLVKRTLIVTPANLSFQWQRELKDKFRESFEVVRSDVLRANYGMNPWQEKNQVITSVSWVSRVDDAKESLLRSNWDLIIVDEAHKMSAYSADKKTLAFQLGEALSQMTDHYLLMTATPHKGDPENFCLFLSLLDKDVYGNIKSLEEAMAKHEAPFYLRRLKEALVSFPDPETGVVKALFTKRIVHTTPFQINDEELDLYDQLTRYVEDQSIKAAREDSARARAVGFTMAMLQRRFASSIYAVRRTLERMKEKREKILEDPVKYRQEQITKRLPEDFEDLTDEEQQEILAELEEAVASFDPNDLRLEIADLEKLIRQSKILESREAEVKVRRLKQLLTEEGIFSDPAMKLLLFTEHKDTLDFLVGDGRDARPLGKLREWGLTVTQIHGGMKIGDRDTPGTRIYAEREFRESCQVLVATEAAGEGINLQFCWLMINYDIPWNPVRLEQRMGRIHRYGQEKDCLIFNFVTTNTREGRVLQKLFERIAEIEKDLDPKRTGKVFNVLGEVFPANQLEKMLRDMYAHNQMTEELIKQRIVEQVDPEHFRNITNSTLEGLAKRELNLSAIIGKSAEAKERRLVPEVIQDFFLQAAPVTGVEVSEQGKGQHTYRVPRVPRHLWPIGERLEPRFGKLGREYKQFVFDKEILKKLPTYDWVTPGHPLFEVVREDLLENVRGEMEKGAVFFDVHRSLPARLTVYSAAIRDGLGHVLHRRLFIVQEEIEGTLTVRQPTLLLDLMPAPAGTHVPGETGKDQTSLEHHLVQEALEPFLAEVAAQREKETQTVARHLEISLNELIHRQNLRLAELIGQQQSGDASPLLAANTKQAEDRLDELNGRLEGRQRELQKERNCIRGRAQDSNLPADSADALITDPPYFAAIPYSDLSNVFFVWERTFYRSVFPDLFSPGLVTQEDEIIVTNANLGSNRGPKDADFYRKEMVKALESARAAVKPRGIGVVVFAESSTSAWEVMLSAVIEAGWLISGSWPIDTELQTRTQAADSASLQSSIHIVCRPREYARASTLSDSVGDWRDVLNELPQRIHEWMPRLADEGIVGADAIFACLGPALEVFSRYSRVEKGSGEPVALNEYLEHVWAAVSKEALAMVFKDADATGFEADARLTAMWLWTLMSPDVNGNAEDSDEESVSEEEFEGKKAKTGGFTLEYDAARKIAQGLGADLENLNHLVEIAGEQARLLAVSERTRHLFGKNEEEPARKTARRKKSEQLDMFAELTETEDAEAAWREKTVKRVGDTTLDRVHQGMILFAAGRGDALKRFVVEDGVGRDGKFWRLAQALSALYPSGSDEKRWVDGVLARKKQLGF